MAIEQMRLARVSAPLDKTDATLAEILASGLFEPEGSEKLYSASLGLVRFRDDGVAAARRAELENYAASAGITLDLLSPDKLAAFSDSDDAHGAARFAERVSAYKEAEAALDEQKRLCLEAIGNYAHFEELDADLGEFAACRYVKPRFGHLPRSSYERIAAYALDHPYFSFFPVSFEGGECWGVYFAPRDKIAEVDGVFASLMFEKIFRSDVTGTVSELIEGLRSNIRVVEADKAAQKEAFDAFLREEQTRMSAAYSRLYYREAANDLKSAAFHNEEYFFISGWVTARAAAAFEKRMEAFHPSVKVETEPPDAHPELVPPVKTRGVGRFIRKFVEPFGFYVDMYGTPSYGDLDVTAFVAVTYTLLFGMMFGDLGQGLVLALAGLVMWKKKKMALGKILVPCGICAACFGFLFGSVFGYEHMLDPVYASLGWAGKPVEVFENVGTILLAAIVIGVVLVTVAILLNIAGCIKRRAYGEALCSQNGLAGLIFYACAVNLASGFMGAFSPLPADVCGAILAVSAVILVFKEPLGGFIDKGKFELAEGIGDFLLQNVFELVEYVLSYLSNTVSFLRVGAFVLVHAGMMMVVFSLAGERANPVVVILGNVLVIALEGLLTGIQALRLEYYEMFSRFYSGEGRKFTPARREEPETPLR